ncbi:PEP-CTERM sorting domain-containing protein [Calothrix sp. FACHB-1219]|uniref:PEP-CTERM sorting domain-containing protein n=1 Tax=unclassified Calothrix TaxID=2619626 RepID=UPI0016858DCB|nr:MULTISPECIES: PEP-CTERM sorting domain-containing protein [unclassified Calothrix]MBD2206739.1 PEP-CTERM sorting domain-containing protein [Calothrix sp. FACHB-168]MBD2219729.1 PEP-CTERM sorting domain-containing protein [Calothrix sp. FACHB-1219]
MKSAKNLIVATIATAISLITITAAKPTQAAIINYKFKVNATSGDNPGRYFGSFRYDDSSLTKAGLETIGVENGLALNFNYLGKNYTQKDDFDFDAFPILTFNNGTLQGLSYFVADKFAIASENINNPDVGGNRFYSLNQSVNATEVGTVSYHVPEPLTVGGTAIATLMGLWMKRKKATKLAA